MQTSKIQSGDGVTTQSSGRRSITDGGEIDGVDLDTLFHLLRSGRRRLFLEYLRTEGAGEFRDIAEFVARGEYGEDYTNAERKRVYISLYQNHVEEMDEAGLIDWNGTGGVVHRGEEFRIVGEFLKCIHIIHGGGTVDDVDGLSAIADGDDEEGESMAVRLLKRLK